LICVSSTRPERWFHGERIRAVDVADEQALRRGGRPPPVLTGIDRVPRVVDDGPAVVGDVIPPEQHLPEALDGDASARAMAGDPALGELEHPVSSTSTPAWRFSEISADSTSTLPLPTRTPTAACS